MDINALNDISYGMYIISTKYKDRNIGCFVNTISQITSENPIISISINILWFDIAFESNII